MLVTININQNNPVLSIQTILLIFKSRKDHFCSSILSYNVTCDWSSSYNPSSPCCGDLKCGVFLCNWMRRWQVIGWSSDRTCIYDLHLMWSTCTLSCCTYLNQNVTETPTSSSHLKPNTASCTLWYLSTHFHSLASNTFSALHSVVNMKSDRRSCVKNETRELDDPANFDTRGGRLVFPEGHAGLTEANARHRRVSPACCSLCLKFKKNVPENEVETQFQGFFFSFLWLCGIVYSQPLICPLSVKHNFQSQGFSFL